MTETWYPQRPGTLSPTIVASKELERFGREDLRHTLVSPKLTSPRHLEVWGAQGPTLEEKQEILTEFERLDLRRRSDVERLLWKHRIWLGTDDFALPEDRIAELQELQKVIHIVNARERLPREDLLKLVEGAQGRTFYSLTREGNLVRLIHFTSIGLLCQIALDVVTAGRHLPPIRACPICGGRLLRANAIGCTPEHSEIVRRNRKRAHERERYWADPQYRERKRQKAREHRAGATASNP